MCIVKEVKHLLAAKKKERKNLRNINFVPFFTTIVKSIAMKIDNDVKDISIHAFVQHDFYKFRIYLRRKINVKFYISKVRR